MEVSALLWDEANEADIARHEVSSKNELRGQAGRQGIGVTQLVRQWVVERLELERRRPGTVDPLLWERTRAAVEDLLREIVARVAAGSKAGRGP